MVWSPFKEALAAINGELNTDYLERYRILIYTPSDRAVTCRIESTGKASFQLMLGGVNDWALSPLLRTLTLRKTTSPSHAYLHPPFKAQDITVK